MPGVGARSPAKDAPGKAWRTQGLCINSEDKAKGDEEGGMVRGPEQGALLTHTGCNSVCRVSAKPKIEQEAERAEVLVWLMSMHRL